MTLPQGHSEVLAFPRPHHSWQRGGTELSPILGDTGPGQRGQQRPQSQEGTEIGDLSPRDRMMRMQHWDEEGWHQLTLLRGWGVRSHPRARGFCHSIQPSLQLPSGAFWSPAGAIDPAPLILVMHGAAPGTNVPSGKGMGRGAGGGPGAASAQLPGKAHATCMGSLLKDTGVSFSSCWLGRCLG